MRWLMAGAVAVLVMCELGATALAGQLPPPGGWYSREVQAQVARIDDLSAGSATCLAFVGSSTIGAAIDPEVMTASLGRDDWYVAWVAGANARVLNPWTEEIVAPKLDPQFVVIGVTSFELNDAYGADGVLDSYRSSPGRRDAIGSTNLRDRAVDLVENVSAFVALRQYFRSPGELVARLTGRIPDMAPMHGQFDGARNSDYGDEPEGMERVAGYVATYELAPRTVGTLETMIVDLQAQGRSVALVALPVLEDEWAAMHEHGAADIDEYRRELASLGKRLGLSVFAYPGELQDATLYRDPIHLNGEGSALFTARLGRELANWMQGEGTGCSR